MPPGLDLSGAWLGDPAVAMSWLDGTPFFPADPGDEWIGSLATALAVIHRAPVPAAPVEQPHRLLAALRSPTVRDRRLQRIATAVEDLFAQPDGDVVFSHGDYHPGNVLFRDGRVTGVVDWFDAGPRSRASDVAYCRGVLAVHPAGDVPDRFLRAYESETGRPLRCDRWDALWAARGFLGARGRWPAALASLGVMITGIEIEQRSAMWAEAALGRLERG